MQWLVSAASMKEIDALAVRQYQIPEILLMEHAAMAVVGALVSRFQRALARTRGLVLAGHGNNGADAVAAARILWNNGHKTVTIVVDGIQKPSPLLGVQLAMAKRAGIPIVGETDEELAPSLLQESDWILDGIFGIGLTRAPEGRYEDWIEAVNAVSSKVQGATKFVLAIDVPSGLDATTGRALGACIRASRTVTFGFHKTGLVTGEALEHVGALSMAAIQIPRELSNDRTSGILIEASDVRSWLPARPKNSHKGTFGKVIIVGSEASMLGASALCSQAALRAGAGLVEAWTASTENARALFPAEVIVREGSVSLDAEVVSNAVLVVGPGLGTSAEARATFKRVQGYPGSMVVDADGLNLLAELEASAWTRQRSGKMTILTPHPKEAARLLESTVDAVQADRFVAATTLAKRYQSIVILKGAGSVIAAPDAPPAVISTGDAGLAKAGTGDVLTGVCAAFLAQGMKPFQAAGAAAFIHGRSSEVLTQKFGHSYSTLASDVADSIAQVLAEL